MMRYLAAVLSAAVVAAMLVGGPSARATTTESITVDGNDNGRTFDGVGAVSSGGSSRLLADYPKRERDEILDYLFKPGYGAALDVLKVGIGADVDATDGAEASHMRSPGKVRCDRGYEWWLMREAKKRNPDIAFYGLPWGAPGWFDGGYWSKDKVGYLLSWLGCAKKNGFKVRYLGGGNESGYDRDFYVHLRTALDKHGYSDVRVVATDEHHPPDYWYVTKQMRDDPEFADAVDVLGEHDVCVWRTQQRHCHTSPAARDTGKPLWDSENSTQDFDVGARPLARAMSRHYIDARITGNLNWALLSAWYDDFPIGGTGLMMAARPWSGSYEVGPSIWVDAHTTQFTQPGWRYLNGASGYTGAGASYVSLRSPDKRDYTTVIETLDSKRAETLRLRVRGGLPDSPVHVWSSDLDTKTTADDFRPAGTIDPKHGSFTLTVRPGHVYTVSTTTGQSKGGARPPAGPGAQLRLPYSEDFEHTGSDRLARYVSDVHGGFQAAPCAGGRHGTCYEQVVTTKPITWHSTDLPPTTMVGDPRWWGNYQVSANALLKQKGAVELLGRVDSQQHNAAGYHLRVSDTGQWKLYSQDVHTRNRTLASGSVDAVGTGSWHRLALRFAGDRITALLDGKKLAAVRDDGHTTGQVGLRVDGWLRAQFDNLRVTPTGPRPRFIPHRSMTVTATSEHAGNDRGHAYPAEQAIDDRLWSSWRSEYSPTAPLPQSLTLDLGRTKTVQGLAYTPPVTGSAGAVTGYAVYASRDGKSFHRVTDGRWAATEATKTAPFDGPVRARYLRLRATDVHGCPRAASAAEINVSRTPLPELGKGKPPEGDQVPDFPHLVPKEQMHATATSHQPGYEAGKAVDGNCATMWHTSWSAHQPPPQSITVDLDRSYDTSALVYEPRQDGNKNGRVTSYKIAVSADGKSFHQVAKGSWPGDAKRKYDTWAPTRARYVRLTGVEGQGGFVSAAELDVAYSQTE